MTRFRSRDVIGRRIVKVEMNRFANGKGGWAFDPVFELDDGTRLAFTVDETESLAYGVRPLIRKKPTKDETAK